MTAVSSHSPSLVKIGVIFTLSSMGLIAMNSLMLYNLFKGSILLDQSQFVNAGELNEFRSALNITVDQRAAIAVSKEAGRIQETVYDETEKVRTLIYQEKNDLSKKIEEKADQIRSEFEEENSKLKNEMNSENSKLKTQMENIETELSDELSALRKDLEAIKKTSDSTEESIEELKRGLKQVDVNKEEAEFMFEIKNFKELFDVDDSNGKNPVSYRVSEFFQVRGISWFLHIQREKSDKSFILRLFAHNPNDNHVWSIRAHFELGFLNQSGGANHTVKQTHVFREKLQYGWNEIIISDNDLDDFVKDDSIKTFVNLKADKLIRTRV